MTNGPGLVAAGPFTVLLPHCLNQFFVTHVICARGGT